MMTVMKKMQTLMTALILIDNGLYLGGFFSCKIKLNIHDKETTTALLDDQRMLAGLLKDLHR